MMAVAAPLDQHVVWTGKRSRALANDLAANRYRIENELGSGASATVFKAFDTVLGRYVALKIVAPTLANQPEFVQRFLQEAQVASRLDHPNIVTIYDIGTLDDGRPFIALQLIEGVTLETLIEQQAPLPPAQAIDVLRQAASALDYLHSSGLVHRDVKPGNILVDANGRAVLTDFGIALALDSARLTLTGMVMGTPRYMAPEQVSDGRLSSASDIYALAVTAFELLSGKPPFEGSGTSLMYRIVHESPAPILQMNSTLPGDVGPVIERALAKKPTDRWPSAGEFVAALRTASGVGTGAMAAALPTSETMAAPALGAAVASAAAASASQSQRTAALVSGSGAQGGTAMAASAGSPAPTPAAEGGSKRRRPLVLIGIAALLAVLVGGGLGIWLNRDNDNAAAGPGDEETATIESDGTASAGTNASTRTPAASRTAAIATGATPDGTSTPDTTATSEPAATTAPANTPVPAPTSAPTSPPAATNTPVPAPTATPTPPPPTATNTTAPTATPTFTPTNTPTSTPTATPTVAPPSAPTNVASFYNGNDITVMWAHPGTNVDGFRIYFTYTDINTNEQFVSQKESAPASARSANTELVNLVATTCCTAYGVSAYNAAGESAITWE